MSTMDFVSDHGWSVFLSTFGEADPAWLRLRRPLCRNGIRKKDSLRNAGCIIWLGELWEKAGEGSTIRCIDKKERVEPQGCLPACLPPRPPIHAPECSPFCLYVRKSISFSFPSPRPNYTTMKLQTSPILPFYRIRLTAHTHPHTEDSSPSAPYLLTYLLTSWEVPDHLKD